MAPVSAAGLLEGVAFGALAATIIGSVAPVVMSATAFSGSAQFATVAVLRADGTLAAALLAAAALNARYLVMSAAAAARMHGTRLQRAGACLLLTDAAFAIAASGDDRGLRARLMGAGAIDLLGWTAGTAIGVLAGGALADPERLGLDAAFPALFAWLLVTELREDTRLPPVALAAAAAVALTPLLPAGVPLLLVGLAAAAWSARR